jgi:nucleotide-binding universal stress UspA family protein
VAQRAVETLVRLDRLARLAEQQGVRVRTQLTHGPGVESILQQVRSEAYSFVVKDAETARGSGLGAWRGHQDARLARLCPTPLWVAHPEERVGLDRVIVAVNVADTQEHDLAVRSLRVAADVAATEGARLTVVHAVASLGLRYVENLSFTLNDAHIRELSDQIHDKGRRRLLAWLDRYGVDLPVPFDVAVGVGSIAAVLEEVAGRRGQQLIVLGSPVRSDMERLLTNAADHVLEYIPTSLMTVTPSTTGQDRAAREGATSSGSAEPDLVERLATTSPVGSGS